MVCHGSLFHVCFGKESSLRVHSNSLECFLSFSGFAFGFPWLDLLTSRYKLRSSYGLLYSMQLLKMLFLLQSPLPLPRLIYFMCLSCVCVYCVCVSGSCRAYKVALDPMGPDAVFCKSS